MNNDPMDISALRNMAPDTDVVGVIVFGRNRADGQPVLIVSNNIVSATMTPGFGGQTFVATLSGMAVERGDGTIVRMAQHILLDHEAHKPGRA